MSVTPVWAGDGGAAASTPPDLFSGLDTPDAGPGDDPGRLAHAPPAPLLARGGAGVSAPGSWPEPEPESAPAQRPLPPELGDALWRADAWAPPPAGVLSSGLPALDRELPGGGWPCGALTEVLTPQPALLEWRLIGPALRAVQARGGCVVLVGPPQVPHLPGLRHAGLHDAQLLWVRADTPSERLWCAEQLLRADAGAALVAWLPQARPEQLRRLQLSAQGAQAPAFVFRPLAAQHEPSAAPLRLLARWDPDWALQLHLLKRRGPAHEGWVQVPSVPGGLQAVMTPRLHQPSRWLALQHAASHVVGRPATAARERRHAAV